MRVLNRCPFFGCHNGIYAIGKTAGGIIIYRCDGCSILLYDSKKKSIQIMDIHAKLPEFEKFKHPMNPTDLRKLLKR